MRPESDFENITNLFEKPLSSTTYCSRTFKRIAIDLWMIELQLISNKGEVGDSSIRERSRCTRRPVKLSNADDHITIFVSLFLFSYQ